MPDYNKRIEDLLDHHLIANEELKKRKEGGGVGYLLNGNMCLGVYGDMLVARIGESLAQSLVSKKGIHRYLPDEGLYDDLIMVDEKICSHTTLMQKFINESIAYTRDLPPQQDTITQLES